MCLKCDRVQIKRKCSETVKVCMSSEAARINC